MTIMCGKADLEKKGHPVTESIINRIVDELLYFLEAFKVFSESGCKKISIKVDYVMGWGILKTLHLGHTRQDIRLGIG